MIYPHRYINTVINSFQEKSEQFDDYIIITGYTILYQKGRIF